MATKNMRSLARAKKMPSAIAMETFVGAAAAVGAFVPVVAVAASAGTLVGWRTAA